CVREEDTAFHAGRINERSIGSEHEGFAARPETWTEPLLRASAALVRRICRTHRIPVDREHIIGHVEPPGATHVDPRPPFDGDRSLALVRAEEPDPDAPSRLTRGLPPGPLGEDLPGEPPAPTAARPAVPCGGEEAPGPEETGPTGEAG